MSAPFRFSQAAFVGGVISPKLWGRVDLEKWGYGLKAAENMIVFKEGGVANRTGTKYVGECRHVNTSPTAGIKPLSFEYSPDQSYLLAPDIWQDFTPRLRVVKDHALVTVSAAIAITGITQANPCVVTAVGHGLANVDQVVLSEILGMTELNGRTFNITVLSANTFRLENLFDAFVDSTGYGAYGGGGDIHKVYKTGTVVWYWPDFVGLDLRTAQAPDKLYVVCGDDPPQKITRTADDNWTVTAVTFAPAQAAPTGPAVAATVASGLTINRYRISAINATTGEESLPTAVVQVANDLSVDGNYNTISWSAASGAGLYVVYKYDGVYGYIGSTTSLSLIDKNTTPDISDTPQAATNPFSTYNPKQCAFHEQRLTFANTTEYPNGVWMSQSAHFENMNVAKPAKADDAVTFKLVSNSRNDIRGLLSLGGLLAFTGKTSFSIKGGADTGFIAPGSILPEPQSSLGALNLPPLDIGEAALYVQRQGGAIRALQQNQANDRYSGTDLALFVPHLFKGRYVVDWCYAETPYNLVVVVLDDGSFLTLTLLMQEGVQAWTGPHWLGGSYGEEPAKVLSATCIEGDEEDEIYFVVQRAINNAEKYYIEYLVPRSFEDVEDAYFVDCGLSYSGDPETVFRNLDHLVGEEVVALADGNVITGLTVSTDGVVTLPRAASVVHIGLPYESTMELLPVDTSLKSSGATQGRRKNTTGVVLRLEDSRGFHYGPNEDSLVEFQQRDTEHWNDPIEPFTGDTLLLKMETDWKGQTTLMIRQSNPLPLTVLAVYPDVVMGGQ